MSSIDLGLDPSRRGPFQMSPKRRALIALAVGAILAGECFAAADVSHWPDANQRQQRSVSALQRDLRSSDGQTSGAQDAATTADLTELVPSRLRSLEASGLSQALLRPIEQAAPAATASAGDPAARAALLDATEHAQASLRAEQRSIQIKVLLSYLGLGLLTALGWLLASRQLSAWHRRRHQELFTRRARLLSRDAADVVATCATDGTITFVTASCEALFGHDPDALRGRQFQDLVMPRDRARFTRLIGLQLCGQHQRLNLTMCHADGRPLEVEGTIANLSENGAVRGLVITVRDVSLRTSLQRRITHDEYHDPLTGLGNRRMFGTRLDHALRQRANKGRALAVLICDVDDFKNINDSLGHGVGDQLLAAVAERISGVVRESDTVARLGGDEFAILAMDCDEAMAISLAERLLARLNEPVTTEDKRLVAHASIGIAHVTPGESTTADVLRDADAAMYIAKNNGKNTYAVYEPELHGKALEHFQLAADLRSGIPAGELVLYYQPKVDLRRRAIVGYEALVRWQHPTRGLLGPAAFVPIAEESSLIVELGDWVLRRACLDAAELRTGDHEPVLSINVAAQQVAREDFVDTVLRTLAETGLPPSRVCLEITESVLIHDLDRIGPRLQALREAGLRIAIDDFGTGYSSLSYLSRLPLDVLKIDKSFVDGVIDDQQVAALTEAIIAMSNVMNLTTIAEGVEHADQAAWLSAAGCVIAQGYLWSRPVPLVEAKRLLVDGSLSAVSWPYLRSTMRRGAPAGGQPLGPLPAAHQTGRVSTAVS